MREKLVNVLLMFAMTIVFGLSVIWAQEQSTADPFVGTWTLNPVVMAVSGRAKQVRNHSDYGGG